MAVSTPALTPASELTEKFSPELSSREVVSSGTPLETMSIAVTCDCHAGELIAPVTPSITAVALVKLMVEKFGIGATIPPTVGASMIHWLCPSGPTDSASRKNSGTC